MTTTDTWEVEHTDTFSGEANYCWCQRATISTPQGASQRQIIRAAKAALGLSNCANTTVVVGDGFEIRYPGRAIITFVNYIDTHTDSEATV